MLAQRSGEHLQAKRFSLEKLLERSDAVFFLRYGAAAVGRINEHDF
jgi:hypothetical protein